MSTRSFDQQQGGFDIMLREFFVVYELYVVVFGILFETFFFVFHTLFLIAKLIPHRLARRFVAQTVINGIGYRFIGTQIALAFFYLVFFAVSPNYSQTMLDKARKLTLATSMVQCILTGAVFKSSNTKYLIYGGTAKTENLLYLVQLMYVAFTTIVHAVYLMIFTSHKDFGSGIQVCVGVSSLATIVYYRYIKALDALDDSLHQMNEKADVKANDRKKVLEMTDFSGKRKKKSEDESKKTK